MNSRIILRLASTTALALGLFAVITPADAEGIGSFFGIPPGAGEIINEETLRNTTGQDANDLHVDVVSHPFGLRILPERATASLFPDGQVTPLVDGFSVDYSNGVVPAGGEVRVIWDSNIASPSNISNHFFTSDGQSLGPGTAPNLAVDALAVAGGMVVQVGNLGSQPRPVFVELFTADRSLFDSRNVSAVYTDLSKRPLVRYRFYENTLISLLAGQTSPALFLPNDFFGESGSSGLTGGSAAGAGGGPVEEDELASLLAGERMIGLAVFEVVTNGTNLMIGLLLVPEPATVTLCFAVVLFGVGQRRRRRRVRSALVDHDSLAL